VPKEDHCARPRRQQFPKHNLPTTNKPNAQMVLSANGHTQVARKIVTNEG